MHIKIFILALCFKLHLSVRILTTPTFDAGSAPPSSFVTIKNSASPALTKISSCFWTSLYLEDLGYVWARTKSSFGFRFQRGRNYIFVDYVAIRYEIPSDFIFTPEKWIFFCFSFDNTNKELKLFLNSQKILDKIIEKHWDNFKIEKNFLQSAKFGDASKFAGKISDLNIWSTILNDEEVKKLYDCAEISKVADVLDWTVAEFDLGPNITLTEKEVHPCLEKGNGESNIFLYSVKSSMLQQRRTLRLCNSLGGIMESPKNEDEFNDLATRLRKLKKDTPCGAIWVPIFKGISEDKWLDVNMQAVGHLNWRRGQPNGGKDHEQCASITGIGKDVFGYIDTPCEFENCFYCKIGDFQHFHLN